MQVIHRFAPTLHIAKKAIEDWEGTLHKYSFHIKIMEDTRDMLKLLSKKYKLALVTNRGSSTIRLLDHFNIRNYFDVVVTANDVLHPKPSPEPIRLALKKLKVKSSEAIYVGDAMSDSIAAKRAKVISANLNKKADSKYHIKDLKEILKVIKHESQY